MRIYRDVDDRTNNGESRLHRFGLVVGVEFQELVGERQRHAVCACVDNGVDGSISFSVVKFVRHFDVLVSECNGAGYLVVDTARCINVRLAVVVFAHLICFERHACLFDGDFDFGFTARPHDVVAVRVGIVDFDETFDSDDAFVYAGVDCFGFDFPSVNQSDVCHDVIVRFALQHIVHSVYAVTVLIHGVNEGVFCGSNTDARKRRERDFKRGRF